MRILLLTNVGVRTSDAGLLLARALARHGAVLETVAMDAHLPALAAVGFDGSNYDDGVYRRILSHHILARSRRFRPDLVFVYGSNWALLPDAISELQRSGVRVVLWEINQRLFRGHEARCIPLYDHVFVLDSYLVPVLQSAGLRRVSHLCACADPEEHYPVSNKTFGEYGSDVCFIGHPHPERIEMLKAVADRDLRIYGAGWAGLDDALDRCIRDEPVYGYKKTVVYSRSRITLNVHGPHMINGENFRVFEVAACGGVSFSRPKPDLVRCLAPGKEVVLFDSPGELRALVDDFLARPADLAELAVAGRRRVLAEHTYHHRAEEILQALTSA